MLTFLREKKKCFVFPLMNGVTFEYANSVTVCPVDVFWRYDLWGQAIVFVIARWKRSLDKGALPTGRYGSSCDILIAALCWLPGMPHGMNCVDKSFPRLCRYSLTFVVCFVPTFSRSQDRFQMLKREARGKSKNLTLVGGLNFLSPKIIVSEVGAGV